MWVEFLRAACQRKRKQGNSKFTARYTLHYCVQFTCTDRQSQRRVIAGALIASIDQLGYLGCISGVICYILNAPYFCRLCPVVLHFTVQSPIIRGGNSFKLVFYFFGVLQCNRDLSNRFLW